MLFLSKIDPTAKWRIYILAITLAMGAALAGTGISGYVQAQKNAEMLAVAEIGAMLPGLRRELSRGSEGLTESLAGYFDDTEAGGFSAAAIVGPDGAVVQRFGKNKRDFDFVRLNQKQPQPGPFSPAFELFEDGVVHTLLTLPKRFGRRRGGPDAFPALRIMTESTSSMGPTIVSNALFALAVELIAAALLLTSALLILRQKASADARNLAMEQERREMAVQLERDERLKALGRMSAVLGHELKNPIAALKGHAQLLLEEMPADATMRKRAATVVEEAKLLETLTEQVLDFIRTGELNLHKVYVDDLVESAAALSGLEAVEVFAPKGVTWMLDRARVEQALVNLLVNARQASPDGAPIDLTVTADEQTLSIQVRDRGTGIAAEDGERIFQPFYTGRARGTGLGLALVKRITDAHGGAVTAANHPKGGAVLTLALPMGGIRNEGDTTHG